MKAILLHRKNWEGDALKNIAKMSKTDVVVVENGENLPEADICFRWGCTANLNAGIKSVVNSVKSIHFGANKALSRKTFQDKGISCPHTFFSSEDLLEALVDGHVPRGSKWVARPAMHMRGKLMSVVETAADIRKIANEYGPNTYFSQLINKKKEERVIIANGRVVQMVNKLPKNNANLNWGVGRFFNIRWGDWDLMAAGMAIAACNEVGLNIGAVDIIYDENNIPYLLEVNSAPEVVGAYSQGIIASVIDYIVEHGKDIIPLKHDATWKNFIHPTLYKDAA